MKMIKRVLIALLFCLIVIQLIHPAKNINKNVQMNRVDLVLEVPSNIQSILEKSCYDCHSNNTVYPWYSKLQPVDWWLNDHIVEGKEELNFSEFGSYKPLRMYFKLREIAHEVTDNEMPLESYLYIHGDAKLSDEQKQTLVVWANRMADTVYSHLSVEDKEKERKRREEREKN